MANLISDQVIGYLDTLRDSLDLPSWQTQPIIDEVSADLRGHVQRHVDAGIQEEDAVSAAIAEMGPPAELGRQMKAAIPPLPNSNVRMLRRIVAVVLGLGLFWLLWNIRAWDYGFSMGRVVAVVSVALTMILLVWPDIIWRGNWLYQGLPTMLVLGGSFLAMTVGTSTQFVDGQPVKEPMISIDAMRIGLCVAFVCLAIYLLGMIQQRRQRVVALTFVLLGVAAIEIPFLVEEYYYNRRLDLVKQTLEAAKQSGGTYPLDDGVLSDQFAEFRYGASPKGEKYTLIWNRPLSPHFGLGYASEGDRMWVLD
ncbi:MAG: permease prefix domain 1-containing protein [Rubripirellula sp.]